MPLDPRRDLHRLRHDLAAATRRIAVLERVVAGQVAAQRLVADELIDLRERVAARRKGKR